MKGPFKKISDFIEKDASLEVISTEERHRRFEVFRTNRKRVTRLAALQALFFMESAELYGEEVGSTTRNANEATKMAIFFYKEVFYKERYGTNHKNQKIDEKFLEYVMRGVCDNATEVDSYIDKYTSTSGWGIKKLDSVIRALLRVATYEILYNFETSHKILTSEYTNLCHAFFDGPEIGFVNAVLDKMARSVRKEGDVIPNSNTENDINDFQEHA